MTRQAVSLWERGGSASIMELRSLCLLYGVSADYILFGMASTPASSQPIMAKIFGGSREPAAA